MSRATLLAASLLAGALVGCATPPPPAAPAPVAAPPPDAPIPTPTVPATVTPGENLPPKVTRVAVSPKSPTVGQAIHVEAEASDPEGIGLTYHYTWAVNGQEDLGEHSDTFTPSHVHKGDVITATVMVRDDAQDSEPQHVEVTIIGVPPVIDTQPDQIHNFDNIHLQAHDPDGGDLTWSISGAPQGMSVDSSGTLHYPGSEEEPGGSYHIVITATDPDGDFAKMELDITISPGSKAKAAADAKAKADAAAKSGATSTTPPAEGDEEKPKRVR